MLPQDVAEVFSWFAYDRDLEFMNKFVLPRHLNDLRKKLDELERDVFAAERQHELYISTGYNTYFYGATRAWCRGSSLANILEKVQLAEGDIIITYNKTLDLVRQVFDMLRLLQPEHPLLPVLSATRRLIRRGVVEQIYNIGFGVMQDELEAGEDPAANSDDVAGVSEGITISPEDLALETITGQAATLDEDQEDESDEGDSEVATDAEGNATGRRRGGGKRFGRRTNTGPSRTRSRTGVER